MRRAAVRLPRVPEKVVQPQGCNLLRSIGARKVYVLGTRRPRGDYQGTRQTPGIADVYAFLPPPRWSDRYPNGTGLWWEAKAEDGETSDAQLEFEALCRETDTPHVRGGLDKLIAWLIAHGYCLARQFAHYRRPEAS